MLTTIKHKSTVTDYANRNDSVVIPECVTVDKRYYNRYSYGKPVEHAMERGKGCTDSVICDIFVRHRI